MSDQHLTSNGYPSTTEKRPTFSDYLRVLIRRKWILVISFVAIFGATAYYTFATDPVYQAATTIIINEDQGMQKALFSFPTLSQQNTIINNQVELLKSRSQAEEVIRTLREDPKRDSLKIIQGVKAVNTPEFYRAVNELRGNLTISPVRETQLITILVRGPSPFEAAYLANTMARVYQSQDREFSQGEVSQIVEFLQEQLRQKEQELRASEEALKNFQESQGISFLSEEAQQLVNQVSQFETLYHTALTDLKTSETRLNYLKKQLGDEKEKLEAKVSSISSPVIQKLREQLAGYERDIAILMSQGVSEDYPDIVRLRAEQDKLKERIVMETRALLADGFTPENPLEKTQEVVDQILVEQVEFSALRARVDALKGIVQAFDAKLEQLPEKSLTLARLERNRKVDENLYMMMKEKHEEYRITQAGIIGKIRIVDTAMPPKEPILPRTKLNLILGTFIGLGLGVGVAFVMEYADNSVRTIEDIEGLNLNVMGSIPVIKPYDSNGMLPSPKKNGSESRDIQSRLITHVKPKSPISEAYRSLRTNIQYSDSAGPIATILVTSAGPREGKSTTVSNLAIAMAQGGNRILVVDTDLRRPVLHRIFGTDKNRGLTNHLVGKASLEEVIHPTGIENLDLIPCGTLPPNPSELLGSSKMRDLIETLKGRYQLVIFDTPPIIAVTDATVLAKQLDAVLLVVKSGSTQREIVLRAKAILSNVQARLLGVLLNNVDVSNTYGYYYYYYYYYYYDQEYDGKRSRRRHKNHRKVFGS